MKFKVLAGLLFLSVLLNVAGIFYMVGFYEARGDINKLKHERTQIEANMKIAQMAASANEQRAVEVQIKQVKAQSLERVTKRNYISHFDNTLDQMALRVPSWGANGKELTLVVYFHGMGSTFDEPFVVPADVCVANAMESVNRDIAVLSVNYRGVASWLNAAAVSDVNQNIRHVMQEYPFKRVIIAGTSMGACSALNYAASAPADIRDKITGVICVEGSADLAALYKDTAVDAVRVAMAGALGGTPDKTPEVYRDKSFINHMENLPKTVKFAVVSMDQDIVVPSHLQFDVVKQLQSKQFPVLHLPRHGPHQPPDWSTYAEAFRYVISPS